MTKKSRGAQLRAPGPNNRPSPAEDATDLVLMPPEQAMRAVEDAALDCVPLESLAHNLDAETEDLNAEIRAFEEELTTRNISVDASVEVEVYEDSQMTTELRFGKYEGQRCLHLVVNDLDGSVFVSSTLLRASRNLRVAAAAKLPDLRRAIKRAILDEIERVQKARLAAAAARKS